MRVGLNLIGLDPQSGGVGRYARELMPALLEAGDDLELEAFVGSQVPEELVAEPWGEGVRWVRQDSGSPLARLRAQWVGQARAARRLDVLHGVANVVALAAPRAARVVTLHDLIWMRHPDAMSRADRLAMRATAIPSARRADRVIAVSHATRDDVVSTLGLDPARVDVVLQGVRLEDSPAFAPSSPAVRAEHGLGDAVVILCVAQKRSHKNLAGLIRAHALLDDRHAVLVLPGAPTEHEGELRALAAQLGVSDRIRLPGWLPEAQVEGLYAVASVFVLPSFEEGFGLPLLEAMRRGVPVACSDRSALKEVAADAAQLFDPSRPEDIARAVGQLLASPSRCNELVERGHRRCRELTWARTAQGTLETYERAMAQVRR